LLISRVGGIWIASDFELHHCDDHGTLDDRGSFKPKYPNGRALVLFEDRSGAVWIGTSADGLVRYDGVEFEAIPTSHHRVANLTEDREGNLWVATQGGGWNRVQPRAIRLEGAAVRLPAETVMFHLRNDVRSNLGGHAKRLAETS
jgi:ligand-binding sensor domain-containing protein